jgi:hypothetical protein
VHPGNDSISSTISTVNHYGLQVYHPDMLNTACNSQSVWINRRTRVAAGSCWFMVGCLWATPGISGR